MKPNTLLRISAALVVTAVAAAMLSAAEPVPQNPRPPRGLGDPGGPGGPGGPNGPRGPRFSQQSPRGGMGGFPIEMVLDEDQRAEFREVMDGQRDKLRDLDEKNAKLRRRLEEALFAKELDEKTVRSLSLALGELEADRTLIRARAFAKVRPSLTEEQLERLKNLRAEIGQGQRPGDQRPGEGGFRPGPPRQPRTPGDRESVDVLPPPAPPHPSDKAPR